MYCFWAGGGTRVTIFGASVLPNCTACTCTFGDITVPASTGIVAANAALCLAPALSSAPAQPTSIAVGITFDGQPTTARQSVPLRFMYYAQPAVSVVLAPLSALEGGAPVTIYGHGFGGLANDSRLTVCGFGTAATAADAVLPLHSSAATSAAPSPLHSLALPYDAITPASRLSDGGLRCIAPSAGSARALASELRIEFGLLSSSPELGWRPVPPQPASILVQGNAIAADGELQLTSVTRPFQTGSAWVMPLAPHAPLTHFRLVSEVRFRHGWGGGPTSLGGLSVCYAPTSSAAFGELGPGGATGGESGADEASSASLATGLVLRLRTRGRQRAELLLDGRLLASAATGYAMRGQDFVPLSIEVDAAHGVSASLDGIALFANVPLPSTWLQRPAPDWRIGFGASSGDGISSHHVRSLRISSALFGGAGAGGDGGASGGLGPSLIGVPVEVSGNGGADFSSGGPLLSYVPRPLAVQISPLVGPVLGDTRITLRGPSLCAGLRPLGCRIGGMRMDADVSRCSNVSLARQQEQQGYHSPGARQQASPRWTDVWPRVPEPPPSLMSEGVLVCVVPPANLTDNLTASGANLTALVADEAAAEPSAALVPPVASLGGGSVGGGGAWPHAVVTDSEWRRSRVRIELSLDNAVWRDAADSTVRFTYYDDAVGWTGGVHPVGGPTFGGTLVRVLGGPEAALALRTVLVATASLEHVRCRFGAAAVVQASANATTGELICVSPPVRQPKDERVYVSLNGQQFTPVRTLPATGADASFRYYDPAPRFSVTPPQGPTAGGTNVTLVGVGLGGGVDYRCRFGHAEVPATLSATDGYVRCASAHAHLALSPPRSGRAQQQTYYGGLSREWSGDGALVLRFDHDEERAAEVSTGGSSVGADGSDAEAADAAGGGGGGAGGGGGGGGGSASNPLYVGDDRRSVWLDLKGGAYVRAGALRLTDSSGSLRHLASGSARATVMLPRPPLAHLSVSMDLLATGPKSSTERADYPHGVALSFGGPRMPLSIPALGADSTAESTDLLPALGADSTDLLRSGGDSMISTTLDHAGVVPSAAEAGVVALLGYGAVRDVGVTNQSVATYLRVLHWPADAESGPPQRHLLWLPAVSLPSSSWRRVQMTVVYSRLSIWLDGAALVQELPLPGWRPAADWAVGVHGSRGEPQHIQWIDNLHIASGALRSAAEVPLMISRNGQQFEAIGEHTFAYRMAPVVSEVTPRAGTAWANTSLVLSGSGFGGGYKTAISPHEGAVWDESVYFEGYNRSFIVRGTYRCVFDVRNGEGGDGGGSNGGDSGTDGDDGGGRGRWPAGGLVREEAMLRRLDHRFEDVFLAEGDAISVPATYNLSDDTILCNAPPFQLMAALAAASNSSSSSFPPSSSPRTGDNELASLHVNLSVSLNGVESGVPIAFQYVNASAIHIEPSSGPSIGHVLVAIHGSGLDRGHDRMCTFGGSRYWNGLGTPASLRPSDLALICKTPSAGDANARNVSESGSVAVHVTLNGRDFNFLEPPLTYTYHLPPTISRIYPPAGPSTGGTIVTLYGVGFGGPRDDATAHRTPQLQCRFGTRAVTALPNSTDSLLRCVAPLASEASAALDLDVTDCELGGTARREATGASPTVLSLARRGEYDSEGACTLRHRFNTSEWSVIDGRDVISTTQPLYGSATEFEATLELRISDGAHGLSFAYGELRTGGTLGALGAGHGLRLRLSTSARPWSVSVAYDGVDLVTVPIHNTPRSGGAGGIASDETEFRTLEIGYGRASYGGEHQGLTVRYDGASVLRGMPIDSWRPLPSWRFGIGARSGVGRDAECAVRRVRLRAGARVEPYGAPVAITRNGQDFLTPAPHPYVYYGEPVISAVTPPSGPLRGGTLILIAGENLHGGSAYSCRLGAGEKVDGRLVDGPTTVTPPLNTTRARPFLHCVTPPAASPGELMPQLSLNGQDETNSTGVPFRYYDPPALYGISPTSGPALGGTRVEIFGANLTSLDANATTHPATRPLRVCRYGPPMWMRTHGSMSVLAQPERLTGPFGIAAPPPHGLPPNEVPATIVNDTYALCISPPSVGGPRDAVSIELSLNGHDFTSSSGLRYQFYAEVRLRGPLPSWTHQLPTPSPRPHPINPTSPPHINPQHIYQPPASNPTPTPNQPHINPSHPRPNLPICHPTRAGTPRQLRLSDLRFERRRPPAHTARLWALKWLARPLPVPRPAARAVRHAVHPCDRCRRWRVAHLCLPRSPGEQRSASRGGAHVLPTRAARLSQRSAVHRVRRRRPPPCAVPATPRLCRHRRRRRHDAHTARRAAEPRPRKRLHQRARERAAHADRHALPVLLWRLGRLGELRRPPRRRPLLDASSRRGKRCPLRVVQRRALPRADLPLLLLLSSEPRCRVAQQRARLRRPVREPRVPRRGGARHSRHCLWRRPRCGQPTSLPLPLQPDRRAGHAARRRGFLYLHRAVPHAWLPRRRPHRPTRAQPERAGLHEWHLAILHAAARQPQHHLAVARTECGRHQRQPQRHGPRRRVALRVPLRLARRAGHRRPRLILLGGRLLPPMRGAAVVGHRPGAAHSSSARAAPSSDLDLAQRPAVPSDVQLLRLPPRASAGVCRHAEAWAGGRRHDGDCARLALGRGGREAHERRRPARGDVDHAARGRAHA